MSDLLITFIFSILCLVQGITSLRSRRAGVICYVILAPISYFSMRFLGNWYFITACAALHLLARGLRWSEPGTSRAFFKHPIFLWLVAVSAATLVWAWFWPVEAVRLLSIVYTYARPFIQILSWFLAVRIGWELSVILQDADGFRELVLWVCLSGVLLSAYGFYQVAAYEAGWPMTGIRRSYVEGSLENSPEEFAIYTTREGAQVFRPGSMVGEPKGLATAAFFWLSLACGGWLGGVPQRGRAFMAAVFLVIIWLTASTSVWVGTVLSLFLYLTFWMRKIRHRFAPAMAFVLILASGVVTLGPLLVPWITQYEALNSIIEVRVTERLRDPLGDIAEQAAIKVLEDSPWMVLTGVGLGGISFYIAEIERGAQFILAPNNGLLGMVCNFGLVLFVWFLVILLRLPRASSQSSALLSSFRCIGLALLLQNLIFTQAWLLAYCIGFLLAAQQEEFQVSGPLKPKIAEIANPLIMMRGF